MKRTIVLAVAVSLCVAAAAYGVPQRTLDNLQAAYNGESSAHARYVAFATQADKEGYARAAALFRAAAKAEEIHAANHAAAIRALGATPQARIAHSEAKTTCENLRTAIEGEVYERDVMYPRFLEVARAENVAGAVKSFNYALHAEAGHAQLYTDAEKNIEQMKAAGGKYFVCSLCGYTVEKLDFKRCPNCLNPKERFIATS